MFSPDISPQRPGLYVEPFAEPLIVDYGYDAVGNRIYVIDPNGSVIFTDYDSANRKYFAQPPVFDEYE